MNLGNIVLHIVTFASFWENEPQQDQKGWVAEDVWAEGLHHNRACEGGSVEVTEPGGHRRGGPDHDDDQPENGSNEGEDQGQGEDDDEEGQGQGEDEESEPEQDGDASVDKKLLLIQAEAKKLKLQIELAKLKRTGKKVERTSSREVGDSFVKKLPVMTEADDVLSWFATLEKVAKINNISEKMLVGCLPSLLNNSLRTFIPNLITMYVLHIHCWKRTC